MKYFSTKNRNIHYSLKEAVLKGLPDDNGLFMPQYFPQLPSSFTNNLANYSFQEIAFELCKDFLLEDVPETIIKSIVDKAIDFEAPLVSIDNDTFAMELFHGPTLAFKDFGARFMAQLMQYFVKDNSAVTTILVATSGDTGSAVANGFYDVDGIEVIILYPKNKVSFLQEKQLTTLGKNIKAIEVDGTFDDCQTLVKMAFLDKEIKQKKNLSSANSINIVRLIPQGFYYANAVKQLQLLGRNIVFSVPSGNFGNLTAGLFVKKMGINIHQFIAATNANNIVPKYLSSGVYNPKPSVQTISNAMDVGNPSNFARMMSLYDNNLEKIKEDVVGYYFDDSETKAAMKFVYEAVGYTLDPHGAVAYLAFKKYQEKNSDTVGVILETAHPAKFIDVIEDTLQIKVQLPNQLLAIKEKVKNAMPLDNNYDLFKLLLLSI